MEIQKTAIQIEKMRVWKKAGISGIFLRFWQFLGESIHSETVLEKVYVVQQIHQQVGQADGQRWT